MREFLIKFLLLLVKQLEKPSASMLRAKELVTWANEAFPGVSGERKRNQVINKLITEFPLERARDLALQIEKVLQEIK